jgi:hypothetical protein
MTIERKTGGTDEMSPEDCGGGGGTDMGEGEELPAPGWDSEVERNVATLVADGRDIFRHDTFGSEAFWSGQLQLDRAVLGEGMGGTGPGLSPNGALALGLKVDAAALPEDVLQGIVAGTIPLDDPATTATLLDLGAVVGIERVEGASSPGGDLTVAPQIGITCALCHSDVDDSVTEGVGLRRDGWPNRDLDIGAIISLALDLQPLADQLMVDEATLKAVLASWGPGKYDALLTLDGKAFRPDGGSAAVLIPAAWGLAGQNLHTYEGWGSVPYWNAYVANTQMRGSGTFVDPRLDNPQKYPLAVETGLFDKRDEYDQITSKLAALQLYQLALPAPTPSAASFDNEAARRGMIVFMNDAGCASCHVPPLFSEPGWAMHAAEEIGIDDFQARRGPTGRYRTTPLAGLFARTKGGFYHDGRFADLPAVIEHYDDHFGLGLTEEQKRDLAQYLLSL